LSGAILAFAFAFSDEQFLPLLAELWQWLSIAKHHHRGVALMENLN